MAVSAAQSRGLRKGTRDAVQAVLAVVAAGGATAGLDLVVHNVNPTWSVLLGILFKILIAYAQNYLETAGKIPVLLPTPGLVPGNKPDSGGGGGGGLLSPVIGTVDAAAEKVGDAVGEVTGVVQDTAGNLLGEVLDVDADKENQ